MIIDVEAALKKAPKYLAEARDFDPDKCTQDKRIYESHKIAMTVANSRLRNPRTHPGNLRAYFCKECDGWHLSCGGKQFKFKKP